MASGPPKAKDLSEKLRQIVRRRTVWLNKGLVFPPLAVLVVLLLILLSPPVRGQAPDTNRTGQMFGRIVVTLGMLESEAIHQLRKDFDVRPMKGLPTGNVGNYLVSEKGSPEALVGSLSARQARITIITSEWTPRTERAGAVGEALFTLLARLSTGISRGGWRFVDGCSVNTIDGLTAGTDWQSRQAEIVCGRQKVVISVSRIEGGASYINLQFTTM